MTGPTPYARLKNALLPILESIAGRDCLAASVALSLPSFGLVEIAAGHRDRERRSPAHPSLLFQAGSQVKTYIGAALVRLAKTGRINLDDPVTDSLPEAEALAGTAPMTIRHLLRHESGVGDFSAFLAGDTPPPWPLPHLTREDLLRLSAIDGRKFEPGADWRYSNSGYALLGMLVERVTGRSLSGFLQEQFLEPLGLKNTSLAPDGPQPHERMAAGYLAVRRGHGTELQNTSELPDMSWARNSGDLITNLSDALTWMTALGADDPRIGVGLRDLSAGATDLWTHPTKYPLRPRHYGFGVSDPAIAGRACWGHGGGTPGYASGAWFEPLSGIGLAFYLTYEDGLHPDTDVLIEVRKAGLLNTVLSMALQAQEELCRKTTSAAGGGAGMPDKDKEQ